MRIPTHDALAFAAALLLLALPGAAAAQEVMDEPGAAEEVVVEDLERHGDGVTGTVVNRTSHEVRDVRLLVRYAFRWEDEFHPGEESPGHAAVVPLEEALPPGGSASFAYTPPEPLPRRDDGHFAARAEVLGFTEVLPPGAAGR